LGNSGRNEWTDSEKLRGEQGKAETEFYPSIRKESWTFPAESLDTFFVKRNLDL